MVFYFNKKWCGFSGGAELLVNHKGSTPLHLAARHGHSGCCRRLVAVPRAASRANEAQRTAVHLAAWQGHHEVGMTGEKLQKIVSFGIFGTFGELVGVVFFFWFLRKLCQEF